MLKRFMTWLLNKIQRVLGAFIGNRRQADQTSSTNLGDEIASRLQQSSRENEEAPAAVREHNALANRTAPTPHSLPTQPALTQSTAPLRQKNSSVLKDTVDPIAKEADTHRRLDAAPAAQPGGAPAVPSFPTDVSDLISASSSLKAVRDHESSLTKDVPISSDALSSNPLSVSNSVPVPNIEAPAAEQLPEIHDLLPAIEPDESNDNVAPVIGQPRQESTADEKIPTEIDSTASLVDAADAETIAEETQADSPLIPSAPETPVQEDVPPASRGAVEVAAKSPSIVDAVTDDNDEQATLFSFDIIENEDNEVSTEENPWLAAQRSIAVREAEPLLTKSGTVKLLFKLKPGNFHGYIEPEDGSKDILFHQKYINAEIFDNLERGARVVATAKRMEGKVYATHVDLL